LQHSQRPAYLPDNVVGSGYIKCSVASLLLLLFHSCQPATVPVNIKKIPVVIKDELQLGKDLFETELPVQAWIFSGFLYHNRSSQSMRDQRKREFLLLSPA